MMPTPPNEPNDAGTADVAGLVSCCIIARNEARMLPDCLASVAGLAADVVVVDTGSDDGTPELAARLGARVFHQPWRDDFSAPRNLARDQAHGQWILLLDADERLGAAARTALRDAIAADDFDCGLLPLHNADSLDAAVEDVVAGRATLQAPELLPRLFRNNDNLQWEGSIHERPTAWLLRGPKRIRRLEGAPIAHYGSVPALRRELGKSERNLRLLELQAAATPDDPRVLDYLAYACLAAGQAERAAEVVAAAWQALVRIAGSAGTGAMESVVTIATLHANFLREGGDPGAAGAVIEQALAWSAGSLEHEHPSLLYQLGSCRELEAVAAEDDAKRLALAARARAAYETCLAKHGQVYPSAVNPAECTGRLAWQRLGTVALMIGDSERARVAFDQVLLAAPDDVAARLGLAEAALRSGDLAGCLREVRDRLAMTAPDALTLAALCSHAADEDGAARGFAAQALQRFQTHRFLAAHRRLDLLALCRALDGASGRQGAGPN